MASQNQQGVTKMLSGANASFNDKVFSIISDDFFRAFDASLCRENLWNFGCPTWLLQKVRRIVFISLAIPTSCAAISDAVRTSLGPRGMDKMVCRQIYYSRANQLDCCRSKPPRARSLSQTMAPQSLRASRLFTQPPKWHGTFAHQPDHPV